MIREISRDIGERLLTRAEAAELLGLSVRTLACWRTCGRGPVVTKLGAGRSSGARYRESEVRAYMVDPVAYDAAHRVREQVRFAPPKRRRTVRRKARA